MGRLQLSAVLLWAIICYVSGQGVLSPNDPYPRGASNLPVPSDPDSSLSLSPEENLAMRDLYNSLIKGSSADFLGIGALEKDAAAMNDHGIQDIEWAVHLFSGIF